MLTIYKYPEIRNIGILVTRKSKRSNPVPLIIEPHPEDYTGYPFITLVEYDREHFLTLIDNADHKTIKAFVLDLCGPAKVDEELVISVAERWYQGSKNVPISFAFSLFRLSDQTSKIMRTFNIDHVTRVIGPLPKFEFKGDTKVRRRAKKTVPEGIEIKKKVVKIY